MWTSNNTNNDDYNDEDPDINTILDDIPRRRTRKTKDGKDATDYVSKEEMWQELHDYYVSLKGEYDWDAQKNLNKEVFPTISPRLTVIITDIATKMGFRANFCTYSWLEEMIGDAVLKMVKAVRDCSFKCYTFAEVVSRTPTDDGEVSINFIDKKGQVQKRMQEATDTTHEESGKEFVKFKANPFGYFSRITTHSYLNRIKKENTLEDTRRAFMELTWENFYSDENFRNVRRPKYIETDDNEDIVEG